jgi:hypothetical protein
MLVSLLLMGAIIPSLMVVFTYENNPWEMYFSMYSKQAKFEALLYTIACSFVLLFAATIYKPTFPKPVPLQTLSLSNNVRNICFLAGLVGILIDLLLNASFGMAASNVVSQRPVFATFLGYLSGILKFGFFVLLIDELIASKDISKRTTILIILYLLSTALAGSRSGFITIFLIIVCALAYSPIANIVSIGVKTVRQGSKSGSRIKIFWIILTAFSIITVLTGQLVRHEGDSSQLGALIFEGAIRFYLNNVALYLAIEDQEKIYNILMDNQPIVVLSQFLSVFGIPRELPSSYRLLEWWGASVEETNDGHFAGYAYGWLGLSFGLFGWFGATLVASIFVFLFSVLRNSSRKKATLYNRLVFNLAALMLFEFFSNLGLDSFVEKAVKGWIYSMLFYLLVIMIIFISQQDLRARRMQ